jgi:hypothetical protein
MLNKNTNWTRETGTTRPTLLRGDWIIVQLDVSVYGLYITGFLGCRERCKSLAEAQTLAEDFVSEECKGDWRARAVPAWIPREPNEPWVQTQLP